MQLKNSTHIYMMENAEETGELARKIADRLRIHDVILLKGELGTGKSVFARSLIQALCGEETEVPSPTFTLVQTYDALDFTLWHFDLYRLNSGEEVYELGIEDAFDTGVSLIEWPERLGEQIPKGALEIEFGYGEEENERILRFKGWEDREL